MAVLATFQHPQTPTDNTGLIQPLPFNTPDSPGLYCENSDEIVASSQPFEDGEYDLLASQVSADFSTPVSPSMSPQGPAPLVAPSSTALAATPSTPLARRARPVRRASPIVRVSIHLPPTLTHYNIETTGYPGRHTPHRSPPSQTRSARHLCAFSFPFCWFT
ncbi:hypothetical protein B0H16DRAFT_1560492 [Mycena metata]|uniref:Uncharacterized protein n=1 Tax=Mycena metata TaxID=1033252 RepID=A0AAD7IKG2_9AGAR|nr:hypothetical protein B0H16DRAFT_1560492 [Mycena metata]